MTELIIDNRATAAKPYERYFIDRESYKTETDLENLVSDCMGPEVYKITVKVDNVVIIDRLNEN